MLWLYKLPATIVFQGRCHGLPLLFQTGRLWGDDPWIIPWDQPETASSTGGHPIEEHNAQGKRKTCGCRLMNTTLHFVVILFQENINTLGNEISKMNRWWKIYRQLLIIIQLIFRSFQADSAPLIKHICDLVTSHIVMSNRSDDQTDDKKASRAFWSNLQYMIVYLSKSAVPHICAQV